MIWELAGVKVIDGRRLKSKNYKVRQVSLTEWQIPLRRLWVVGVVVYSGFPAINVGESGSVS
jgi:hypothetical protein